MLFLFLGLIQLRVGLNTILEDDNVSTVIDALENLCVTIINVKNKIRGENMLDVKDRIVIYRELLSSVGNIFFTELNRDFEVISSNSSYLNMFKTFFSMFPEDKTDHTIHLNSQAEDEEMVAQYERTIQNQLPGIITNSLGMSCIFETELRDGKIHQIYLLGPVFLDGFILKDIEKKINRMDFTLNIKSELLDVTKVMPIVSLNRFFEYGIMLHCVLTGKKVTVHDFLYVDTHKKLQADEQRQMVTQGLFLAEQHTLKLVEEGNLNYQEEMKNYTSLENPDKNTATDYLRKIKNDVIVFSVICAAGAIKGGVSPEIVYLLRDQYIKRIEEAPDFAAVNLVKQNIVDDYVRRVHRTKMGTGISPQIKKICDHISFHLEEQTNIHKLASLLGYTDYYFSNKFKKETGFSVREYATKKKIEKACDLLIGSNMDIQSISDILGYSSQSYFGEVFRREMGMSPGEYRRQQSTTN